MAEKAKTPTQKVANLRFRAATEADYEGVMDVNREVYHGADYLSGCYMQYVSDPKRFLFVAEDSQGKVVAFVMRSVIDEGTRVVGQAARIHQDYQRIGMLASFSAWATLQTRARVPTLVDYTWTTKETGIVTKRLTQNPGVHLVTKRIILSMSTSPGDLDKLLKGEAYRRAYAENHCDTSTVLTARQAQDILKRGEVDTTRVVPEGMWVTGNWEPYGLLASNYEDMVKDAVVITRGENDDHIVAISFSNPYQCHLGAMHYVHFYSEARGGDSLPLVQSHILKHLTLLQQHAVKEHLLLWLFMPEYVPVKPLREFVFDELGFRKISHPFFRDSRMDMYCLLRKLDNEPVKANM